MRFLMVAFLESGILHFILPVLFASILFVLAMFFNEVALPYVLGFFGLEIVLAYLVRKKHLGGSVYGTTRGRDFGTQNESVESGGQVEWQD